MTGPGKRIRTELPVCADGLTIDELPHSWHQTTYRNSRLRCGNCGARVVLRGVWFDIRGLPNDAFVCEKLKDCIEGRVHEWSAETFDIRAYRFTCRHCGVSVAIRGAEYEVPGK